MSTKQNAKLNENQKKFNKKSAKDHNISQKNRIKNIHSISKMKRAKKIFLNGLNENKTEVVKNNFINLQSAIFKSNSKGAISKKKASRILSRAAKKIRVQG